MTVKIPMNVLMDAYDLQRLILEDTLQYMEDQKTKLAESMSQQLPVTDEDNENDFESHDKKALIFQNHDNKAVFNEAAVLAAGKVVFDSAVFVGSKVIDWFKAHHEKTHLPPPPDLKFKKIALTILKLAQIAIPVITGILIVLAYAYPDSSEWKIILAGIGVVSQFLMTYGGNKTASSIYEAEKDYIGSLGLNLGVGTMSPSLASAAGVHDLSMKTLVEASNKKKRWCQWFTDPWGCCFCFSSGLKKEQTKEMEL